MVIVVMGVSGVGKTTVGRALAVQLGWPFRDADDVHSPANVERMRRGEPLTDEHRAPWLAALAGIIATYTRDRRPLVLACSALSGAHREALLAGVRAGDGDDVRFVHLRAERAVLAERLGRRTGHFFPRDLLDSQLATLEAPVTGTPGVLELDATRPVSELVEAVRNALGV